VLFVPLLAHYLEPPALVKVLPFYLFAAAVGGAVLLATYTSLGTRYAPQLNLLFVLGLTSDLLVYLYLEPYATPTYPATVANLLTCLLMASAAVYSWRTRLKVLLGTTVCAGFTLLV